ncbi:MAG: DsbE family thiol:disulfide interchange protein [Pseudomonadota bacterium]
MSNAEPDAPKGGFRLWMIVPALGAASVLAVFLLGLQRDDVQRLPSALIDKPVPDFELPALRTGEPSLTDEALATPGVKLVNIWASWCGPCRIEHPYLMEIASEGTVVHGINYKDQPGNALAFLEELGDPYELIGTDETGRAGIEFGVYGVPETFVINADGKIVYKQVGPVTQRELPKLRAAIEQASKP